jgi:hypothetical protein
MTSVEFAMFFVLVSLPTILIADDVWHVRPGEAYNPTTYCNWNRTGLPLQQQAICAALDRKSGIYQPRWKAIAADNGASFELDLNSISHNNQGGADAVIYAVEGGFNPANMRRLIFDCRGHYMDADSSTSEYAPPNSVIGQIATIVCNKSKK